MIPVAMIAVATALIQRPPMTIANIVAPVIVSALFVSVMSLLHEPDRHKLSALLIAGAGAVYFGGGFGWWEVAFCGLLTWLSFRGLDNYSYIAIGWLMHIGWDVVHHLYGRSILPFVPLSSAGCAICDTGIAIWYFLGAPSVWRRRSDVASMHSESKARPFEP
jgi:Family of unknown function (DUF6010)